MKDQENVPYFQMKRGIKREFHLKYGIQIEICLILIWSIQAHFRPSSRKKKTSKKIGPVGGA